MFAFPVAISEPVLKPRPEASNTACRKRAFSYEKREAIGICPSKDLCIWSLTNEGHFLSIQISEHFDTVDEETRLTSWRVGSLPQYFTRVL